MLEIARTPSCSEFPLLEFQEPQWEEFVKTVSLEVRPEESEAPSDSSELAEERVAPMEEMVAEETVDLKK